MDELKKGHTDVKISLGTIHADLKEKQAELAESFKSYIENELPHLHRLAVTGLEQVLKEAWRIYESDSDNKTKLHALAVIQSAIMNKQSVLGDPSQIERAIKVVAKIRKTIQSSDDSSNSGNSTEDQKEESQEQEVAQ